LICQLKKGERELSKNYLYTLCWFVLTALLLCACQSSSPPFECTDALGCVTIAPGEPVKLGVIQALSGGTAPIGTDQVRGIGLAVAARGEQLLGHPIELQIEDERCSSEGGTIAAMRVVADPQVVAIIGTTCSGAATTASEVMSEAGLVMISGSNTAPSLTAINGEKGADWHPGYLRTISSQAVGVYAAATFVFEELGVTKAATINDGDSYTRGYTDMFEEAFTGLGGEVVLDAVVNKGDTDMKPVLEAVAQSGAELVFFPIFSPEADFIVLQIKEVDGLENTILLGGGALHTDDFVKAVGEDGVGLYVTGMLSSDNSSLGKLTSAYKTRYGEEPPTTNIGRAYDAANLLLDGIEAAAVQEQDGTLHIKRQTLRETLYATTNMEGVSGTLICDQFGDCNADSFAIFQLDDPAAGLEGFSSNVVYTYSPE
jgi:branched-chain amino acid transport system substrate-binding protein